MLTQKRTIRKVSGTYYVALPQDWIRNNFKNGEKKEVVIKYTDSVITIFKKEVER